MADLLVVVEAVVISMEAEVVEEVLTSLEAEVLVVILLEAVVVPVLM